MDEFDKVIAISISGEKANAALEKFRVQMDRWGLQLPPASPLLIDFGLNDYENCGLIECWIANEIQSGYCGKLLFVFDRQKCPFHSHRHKHETFFIIKGTVRMQYDGSEREMNEGEVLAVAPGNVHGFCGIGAALLLELSMPCLINDNYFENTDISIGGNYRARN